VEGTIDGASDGLPVGLKVGKGDGIGEGGREGIPVGVAAHSPKRRVKTVKDVNFAMMFFRILWDLNTMM
jgi:hypothetical protein